MYQQPVLYAGTPCFNEFSGSENTPEGLVFQLSLISMEHLDYKLIQQTLETCLS